jgi:hypothetical protein
MNDDLDLKSTYDYDEQQLPSKDTKDSKDTSKDKDINKSSVSSTTPTIINNNNNNFNNKETIIERIIEKPIFINNNNNHSLQPSTLSSTDIKFNIIKPQPKHSFSHNINYSDSKESSESPKEPTSTIKSTFKSNITNNKNTISISGIDVYASRVDSTKLDINPVSLAVNMLSNNKNVVSILNNKMSIVVNGTILDKINYLISFVLQDRLGQKSLISDLVNAVINETTENKIDYNSIPRIIIVIIDLLNNSMERTYLRIITKRDVAIFIKLFFIVLIEAKIISVKFEEKPNIYKLFDDCIELLQRKIRVNKRSIFWWMTCCCSGCCGYKTWGCM